MSEFKDQIIKGFTDQSNNIKLLSDGQSRQDKRIEKVELKVSKVEDQMTINTQIVTKLERKINNKICKNCCIDVYSNLNCTGKSIVMCDDCNMVSNQSIKIFNYTEILIVVFNSSTCDYDSEVISTNSCYNFDSVSVEFHHNKSVTESESNYSNDDHNIEDDNNINREEKIDQPNGNSDITMNNISNNIHCDEILTNKRDGIMVARIYENNDCTGRSIIYYNQTSNTFICFNGTSSYGEVGYYLITSGNWLSFGENCIYIDSINYLPGKKVSHNLDKIDTCSDLSNGKTIIISNIKYTSIKITMNSYNDPMMNIVDTYQNNEIVGLRLFKGVNCDGSHVDTTDEFIGLDHTLQPTVITYNSTNIYEDNNFTIKIISNLNDGVFCGKWKFMYKGVLFNSLSLIKTDESCLTKSISGLNRDLPMTLLLFAMDEYPSCAYVRYFKKFRICTKIIGCESDQFLILNQNPIRIEVSNSCNFGLKEQNRRTYHNEDNIIKIGCSFHELCNDKHKYIFVQNVTVAL